VDVLAGRVEAAVDWLQRLREQDVPAALAAVERQT
jgi:hypothetical protein